jgi:hypothetical protein
MEHEQQQAEALRLSQRSEEEARWAREDARRWVAEHRQASLDLLEKLEPWVRHLRGWSRPFPGSTSEQLEAERRDLRRYDWRQASDQVQRAWATLQLVVSDHVRDAYGALLPQMYLGMALSLGEVNQDHMDTCVDEVNACYDRLLLAIRADLGVTAQAQRSDAVQQLRTPTPTNMSDGPEPSTIN